MTANHTFACHRRLTPWGVGVVAAMWLALARAAPGDPAAELRALAGGPVRLVWSRQVSGEGGDPFATNSWYSLIAFDTEAGGERVLVPGPRSVRKPLISPDGEWVVFTDYARGRVMAVRFGGGEVRDLADGHAADVWRDPADGRLWVFAVRGPLESEAFLGSPAVRFPLDAPSDERLVWTKTPVSVDNFQVTADGARAAALAPWPTAAWLELPDGAMKRVGRGCWTSRAPDDSRLMWLFDGAHRNLLICSLRDNRRWTVPVNTALGMQGAEVYHPRWGRPAHLFALTGPYLAGSGPTRIHFGGPRVEVFVGRFAAAFDRVDAWVQVTRNDTADYFPDVWSTAARPPPQVQTERTAKTPALTPPVRHVIEARVVALTRTPTAAEIRPYDRALIAFEYEVLRTLEGPPMQGRILVLHWGVRDRKPVAPRRRLGETVQLALEPYEAHPELEGERIVMDMADEGRPQFIEVPH
ncbi:MAG: hypothetical protein N2652_03980 [Kiritimatiellae bacterium]|nr:hypothetical protein [Kiritimatiellia bacterium]